MDKIPMTAAGYTALDLAGTGRADAGSLVAATRLAIEFASRARPATAA